MFLEAGKHVCVEYPMTLSYKAAAELWDLAQKKGGTLKPGFGFPAFSGIARLCWLVDLFGELSVTAATFEQDAGKGYSKMTAQLLTSNSRLNIILSSYISVYCRHTPLTWVEERQDGLLRTKKVNFVFDDFAVTQIPSAPKGTVGLFMQDLIHFSAKLSGQTKRTVAVGFPIHP
ncbi:hypothetical protein XENOCAPTIV_028345 [Xenoophorus captivus]|uniref:Biliverdin reductase catalytic domain-containing protein n=1 Tax=Xenoophorus captivus TaxID=1517983 RepID=A0ABV0RDX2_9TELE